MDQVTQKRFSLLVEEDPVVAVEFVLKAAKFAAQDGLHRNGGAKWAHPPECDRITHAVFGKDLRAQLRFERRVHKHLRNMLAQDGEKGGQ